MLIEHGEGDPVCQSVARSWGKHQLDTTWFTAGRAAADGSMNYIELVVYDEAPAPQHVACWGQPNRPAHTHSSPETVQTLSFRMYGYSST